MTTEPLRWVKSSYSGNGGQCVEVVTSLADRHGIVPVRDSKVPSGHVLNLPADAFTAFVEGVKGGQLGGTP
ncbi:DUF397 domain-containing protein [Streptomyces sp. Da 82-17]|uniref:DUF397 domain-containing protein n=1 Tax=Streptomyces sp. Da 82-17 TaxID=3377116 RepID=UPI0038D47CE9